MSTTTESDKTSQDTVESLRHQEKPDVMLRSLKSLLEGDEQEQRETFAYLKQALDEDRPSHRKLFQ